MNLLRDNWLRNVSAIAKFFGAHSLHLSDFRSNGIRKYRMILFRVAGNRHYNYRARIFFIRGKRYREMETLMDSTETFVETSASLPYLMGLDKIQSASGHFRFLNRQREKYCCAEINNCSLNFFVIFHEKLQDLTSDFRLSSQLFIKLLHIFHV